MSLEYSLSHFSTGSLYSPSPAGFLIRTDDMDFIGALDTMTADDSKVR
jgi:hypothetical protein